MTDKEFYIRNFTAKEKLSRTREGRIGDQGEGTLLFLSRVPLAWRV